MKVAHAIATLDQAAGGPVNALRGLAQAQAALGLNVHVLTGDCPSDSPIRADLESAGVQITDYQLRGRTAALRAVGAIHELSKALLDSDVLHVHGVWNLLPTLAAEVARRRRLPYVVRPCGMLDAWSLTQRPWRKRIHLGLVTRRILEQAALIHATTPQEQIEVRQLGPLPPVLVRPNGVDERAFAASSEMLSEELKPLFARSRVVLYLGRVHPKKGLDLLVQAFAETKSDGTCLLVVGPRDAGYYEDVQAQISRLGLTDRVKFLNPLYGPERFSVYAASHVFALPSQQENFGITVAEAMACGTPVIVSPEVALSAAVKETDSGLVVTRNPTAFAQSIDQTLMNEEQRLAMGCAGRRTADARYRWSSIAEQWRDTYASTVAVARRRPTS